MTISTIEADKLDNSSPVDQDIQTGTEIKANQDNIKANQDNITAIMAGQSIALPTSDPGVAGQLWANNLIVTVSAD